MPYPKTIGGCVDRLYAMKDKKATAKKAVDKIEEEMKDLENHIIETFSKDRINGAQGRAAKASILRKPVPTITDKEQLIKYIKKTGQFDLFQQRLSTRAVQARWDEGEKVPGVGTFETVKLSITKVRG